MGKLDFITKVSGKVAALWGGFIKKSPVFIVLTGLTVVSVLGLGVGGTLAATGVIPNPFVPSTSPDLVTESPDSTSKAPGDGMGSEFTDSWVSNCYNEETKVTDLECHNRGTVSLQEIGDSGWTGVKVFLNGDMLTVVFSMPVTSYTEFPMEIGINGEKITWGPIICWPEPSGLCTQSRHHPIDVPEYAWASSAPCKPEGDSYFVKITGPGLNFMEEGPIPEGNLNCPSRPLPNPHSSNVTPSPTPESSDEPTSSPSPTPESSPTPEASPTP